MFYNNYSSYYKSFYGSSNIFVQITALLGVIKNYVKRLLQTTVGVTASGVITNYVVTITKEKIIYVKCNQKFTIKTSEKRLQTSVYVVSERKGRRGEKCDLRKR